MAKKPREFGFFDSIKAFGVLGRLMKSRIKKGPAKGGDSQPIEWSDPATIAAALEKHEARKKMTADERYNERFESLINPGLNPGYTIENPNKYDVSSAKTSDTLCIAPATLDITKLTANPLLPLTIIAQDKKGGGKKAKPLKVDYDLVVAPDGSGKKILIARVHFESGDEDSKQEIRECEKAAVLEQMMIFREEDPSISDIVVTGDYNENTYNKDRSTNVNVAKGIINPFTEKGLHVNQVGVSQPLTKTRLRGNLYADAQFANKGGREAISSSMWTIAASFEKTKLSKTAKKLISKFPQGKEALDFTKDDTACMDHLHAGKIVVRGLTIIAVGNAPTKGNKAIDTIETYHNMDEFEKLPIPDNFTGSPGASDMEKRYANLTKINELSTNKLMSLFARKLDGKLGSKENEKFYDPKSAAFNHDDDTCDMDFAARINSNHDPKSDKKTHNDPKLEDEDLRSIFTDWINSEEFQEANKYLKDDKDRLNPEKYIESINKGGSNLLKRVGEMQKAQTSAGYSPTMNGVFNRSAQDAEKCQCEAMVKVMQENPVNTYYVVTESGDKSKTATFKTNLIEGLKSLNSPNTTSVNRTASQLATAKGRHH